MLCAVLFRLAMKLATGAGNTTVIAMLIGAGQLFRFLLTLAAFDLSEKKDQPLGNCRVSENRIAQHGKRHSPDHRSLNGGHQLARLDAKKDHTHID